MLNIVGEQKIRQKNYDVELVAPEGLSYGDGPISVDKRLQNPEDALTHEIMETVDHEIRHGEILLPISRNSRGQLITDDGCGDGRGIHRVLRGTEFLKRSLNRAKVFGGGLTMGVAADIGLGKNGSLKSLFESAAGIFRKQGLDYGAHTDESSNGKKSGCGAIDNAPVIVNNISGYKDNIRSTMQNLGGLLAEDGMEYSEDAQEEVLDNFQTYVDDHPNENYNGTEVMEVIAEEDKVIKELDSKEGHREVAIILNFVSDMTVNQQLIREKTGNVAQVFAVDVPRLRKIAARLYSDEAKRNKAVLSMMAYTLSTAATLTDGTLPVYAIRPAN